MQLFEQLLMEQLQAGTNQQKKSLAMRLMRQPAVM